MCKASLLFPSHISAFMFLMPLSPFYLALWFLQMFGRIRPFPVSQLLEKWPRISLLVCNIREEALFFNWKQEEPKTNLNIIKTWKFSWYFHWSVVYTWGNFGSLSSYLWILKCAWKMVWLSREHRGSYFSMVTNRTYPFFTSHSFPKIESAMFFPLLYNMEWEFTYVNFSAIKYTFNLSLKY